MFKRFSWRSVNDFDLVAVRHLSRYEGEVAHLYLDTRGNPTIGIGFHVANKSEFAQLPLRESRTKRHASREHKLAEFERIKRLPPACPANFYTNHCELYLSHNASQKILLLKIQSFKEELKRIYGEPLFNSLPTNAKLALLDMIYTLGQTQLQNHWPLFNDAVRKRDWQAAAQQSNRKGVSVSRNAKIKQLLESAHHAPSWWQQLWLWFQRN